MNNLKKISCFLAGTTLPLAFAPIHAWPLAILAPALFLYLLMDQGQLTSAKEGMVRGFLFGLGFFGVGASWVYVSIHTYGDTNIFFACLITAIFLFILSSFYALFGWAQCRFFSASSLLWLTFPSLGVLSEAFLGKFFTGFPWLFLGYSQTISPLRGFAPLLGVYGVSFLVFLAAALLYLGFAAQAKYKLLSVILLSLLFAMGYSLSNIQWTKVESDPVKIALVQGNIPQEIKWEPGYAQHIVDTYVSLSSPYWHNDLLLWPEGAIPVPLPSSLALTQALASFANTHHSTLITGIPSQALNSSYYNSLLELGQNQGIYHKRLLVPFGEYIPLTAILKGLIGFFNLPMSDFIPGQKHQPPLIFGKDKVGTFICYEIAYPDRVLESLSQRDAFLTVISNDAWFGHSWASAQHAQIAQFAALATQRYLALSSNNGITAIIDPQGKFVSSLPPFTSGVLTGTIIPSAGKTPWGDLGNLPLLILFLIFLAFARAYSSGK